MIHPAATSNIDLILGRLEGYGTLNSCLSFWAQAELLSQGGGSLAALKFRRFKNRFSPYMQRFPLKGSDKDLVKLALIDDEAFPKPGLTLLVSKAHALHKQDHELNLSLQALYSSNPPRSRVQVTVKGDGLPNDEDDDERDQSVYTQFQALHKVQPEWDEYIHFTPEQLGWSVDNKNKNKTLTLTLKVLTENFVSRLDNDGEITLKFTTNENNPMLDLSRSSWHRHCRLLENRQDGSSALEDQEDIVRSIVSEIKPALEFQVMIRPPDCDPPKVCC